MFSQVTQVGNIYQLTPAIESLTWCKIPGENVNITDPNTDRDQGDRLLPTLLECLVVIFCGFLAGKCNLISPTDIKGLNDFISYFSLPPLIFLNLTTINFQNVDWYFVLAILLGKIVVFTVVAFVTAAVRRPLNLSYAGIYGIFCTQGNDFGLAYPIIMSLYGSKRPMYAGYLYLIAPTSLVATNPMGFFLMEMQKRKADFITSEKSKPSPLQEFLQTLGTVSWNIFKNPVVFVTILGIFGNFLFHDGVPSILYGILQILSSAFSSSILFLLGFSVIRCGSAKSASKEGLLIPVVLIIAKMILSPIITRAVVVLLCSSAPDADDLADYGFIYGFVPTGPIVLLFAAEYCLRTEVLASTMVVCTALFGPIMFLLSTMLSLTVRGLNEFAGELRTTMLVLSLLSMLSCAWIGLCMVIGKKFKHHLYKITGFLMFSQTVLAIGVFMWATIPVTSIWLEILQVTLVAAGQLMSRLWMVLLALFLAIKERNAFSPFVQNISWPMSFGFGIPLAVVIMLFVLTSVGKCQPQLHNELPFFSYGESEAIAATIVLSLSLVIISSSIIIYYRTLSRSSWLHTQAVKAIKDSACIDVASDKQEKQTKMVTDGTTIAVYKLTKSLSDTAVFNTEKNETKDTSTYSCIPERPRTDEPGGHSQYESPPKDDQSTITGSRSSLDIISVTSSSQIISPSSSTDFDIQKQIHPHLRHVILLILASISIAVGLTVSTWKFSTKQPNGLLVSMEFLDSVLNVAQGFFVFLIFWRESKYILTPLAKWFRHVRRGFYNVEDDAGDNVVDNFCRQFRRYHWINCLKDLPRTFSTENHSYKDSFTGKDLVDWLMLVGLANHRTAAEVYGQQLFSGGLLISSNDAVQFHDSHAYFYQLKDSEKFK